MNNSPLDRGAPRDVFNGFVDYVAHTMVSSPTLMRGRTGWSVRRVHISEVVSSNLTPATISAFLADRIDLLTLNSLRSLTVNRSIAINIDEIDRVLVSTGFRGNGTRCGSLRQRATRYALGSSSFSESPTRMAGLPAPWGLCWANGSRVSSSVVERRTPNPSTRVRFLPGPPIDTMRSFPQNAGLAVYRADRVRSPSTSFQERHARRPVKQLKQFIARLTGLMVGELAASSRPERPSNSPTRRVRHLIGRVSDCKSEVGYSPCRFDSYLTHQLPCSSVWSEHPTDNREVVSSNLTGATICRSVRTYVPTRHRALAGIAYFVPTGGGPTAAPTEGLVAQW